MLAWRLEAFLVAILTMASSTVYIYKLSDWASQDSIKTILANSVMTEVEQDDVKHVFDSLLYLSIIGNVFSFLTSLPLFLVITKNMETNRKRRYALLPYILCHTILGVTAFNRLLLTFMLSENSVSGHVISVRAFSFATIFLSLVLIGMYYYNLSNYTTTFNKTTVDDQKTSTKEYQKLEEENVSEEKKDVCVNDGDTINFVVWFQSNAN